MFVGFLSMYLLVELKHLQAVRVGHHSNLDLVHKFLDWRVKMPLKELHLKVSQYRGWCGAPAFQSECHALILGAMHRTPLCTSHSQLGTPDISPRHNRIRLQCAIHFFLAIISWKLVKIGNEPYEVEYTPQTSSTATQTSSNDDSFSLALAHHLYRVCAYSVSHWTGAISAVLSPNVSSFRFYAKSKDLYALWLFNPIKLHAARFKQQHSVESMCIRSDIYVRCWPEDKGVARFTTSTLRLLPKIFVFVVPLLDQNFLFWRCYLDPWPVIDFDIAIFQDLLNLLESCK